MPNEYHKEDVRTGYEKVKRIVGHTDKFRHPTEKARDLANLPYYENEHLDPLPIPDTDKVGP